MIATLGDRCAMLVGDVSEKVLNQFRLYGLVPQYQQDSCGFRREVVIPLRKQEHLQAFKIACQQLRINY